jgi:macrolide transport system ATP-binding/permease protein
MSLLQDVRVAVRGLVRSPAFTIASLVTLALGIGASTAIFTVFHRVILAPLPAENPEELVHLVVDRGPDGVASDLSYPVYREYREGLPSMSGLAARSPQSVALTLSPGSPAERISAEMVSGNYFQVMGVPMARGPGFGSDVDQPSGSGVVVLSHRLWQRLFAGDPGVIGRSVTINGAPVTVVGVTGGGYQGVVKGEAAEAWVPVGMQPRLTAGRSFLEAPGISWLEVIGRVRAGTNVSQLQGEMTALDRANREIRGWPAEWHLAIQPIKAGFTWFVAGFDRPLRILLVVVGLVLIMACANVANLLMVRAAGRRREIAVRLSLGATRRQVVRQLLVESLVLSLAAGTLGMIVTQWVTNLLLSFRPDTGSPIAVSSSTDAAVLAFTLGLSLVTGCLFGLVPAVGATRADIQSTLRGNPPAVGRRFGLRGTLVATQIAISLVLLIGTGLFLRSLQKLQAVNVGYDERDVLLASIDLADAGLPRERGAVFYAELEQRLRATPEVRAVSLSSVVPPHPFGSNWSAPMRMEGYEAGPDEMMEFDINTVTGSYFGVLGIPLVAGRSFDDRDGQGGVQVAIINETMAQRYWPGKNPVGLHFQPDRDNPAENIKVIGVARDGKYRALREEPKNLVYFPLTQRYRADMTLLLRGSGGSETVARMIRERVNELAPGLPVYDVKSLHEHLSYASSGERMVTLLVSLFGALAVALAAVGLYGLIAYQVAQGRREIGIRMALGADWRRIRQHFIGQGVRTMLVGAAAGVVLALASGRLIASQLYDVAPHDWAALLGAMLFLSLVVLAASWIPARRAAQVEPTEALRGE